MFKNLVHYLNIYCPMSSAPLISHKKDMAKYIMCTGAKEHVSRFYLSLEQHIPYAIWSPQFSFIIKVRYQWMEFPGYQLVALLYVSG